MRGLGFTVTLGMAGVLSGVISSWAGGGSVVRGRALYRERVALPPDAVFEATLEDVSRADAKAYVLGTVRVENAGPVPIRFAIPYDPGTVDERHVYAVRARILRGQQLLFTTDTTYPVLTRGHGNQVELLLVRSRGAAPHAEAARSAAPLRETHWTLVELDGKPIAATPQEPYLIFQVEPPRVSGSGGCNRLTGAYEHDGDRLRFGALAGTRRACIDAGMHIEDAFYAVLEKVRGFRIAGQRLELLDDSGTPLAAFRAVELYRD